MPVETKKRPGGKKSPSGYKEQLAGALAEIRELKSRLEMPPTDLESWALIPQEWRDEIAAKALVAEWMHWGRALIRLGFKLGPNGEYKAVGKQIFETPGCIAQLELHRKPLEENKASIIERQVQIALHHTDPGLSTRAAELVARVAGWRPADGGSAVPLTVNLTLQQLVGAGESHRGPKTVDPLKERIDQGDPLAILSHDPGDAIRIDSGDDAIAQALE